MRHKNGIWTNQFNYFFNMGKLLPPIILARWSFLQYPLLHKTIADCYSLDIPAPQRLFEVATGSIVNQENWLNWQTAKGKYLSSLLWRMWKYWMVSTYKEGNRKCFFFWGKTALSRPSPSFTHSFLISSISSCSCLEQESMNLFCFKFSSFSSVLGTPFPVLERMEVLYYQG